MKKLLCIPLILLLVLPLVTAAPTADDRALIAEIKEIYKERNKRLERLVKGLEELRKKAEAASATALYSMHRHRAPSSCTVIVLRSLRLWNIAVGRNRFINYSV